jgi:hypothetical protein
MFCHGVSHFSLPYATRGECALSLLANILTGGSGTGQSRYCDAWVLRVVHTEGVDIMGLGYHRGVRLDFSLRHDCCG